MNPICTVLNLRTMRKFQYLLLLLSKFDFRGKTMIYLNITLSSLIAVYLHSLYIRIKRLRVSKILFFLEFLLFWLLSFGIFYLKAWSNFGNWSFQNIKLSTFGTGIIIGVILALFAIMLNAYIYQIKTDKYKTRCLFTVKGIQFFPLNSFIYTLTGLLIVVASMFIIEHSVDLFKWNIDDGIINNMNFDKISTDTKYPLVKIKGTSLDTDANVKILVLGDSFVFGYGSSNLNYLWWNQLSGELTRRGYNCTVYAVGQGGASTYDELKWLKNTSMISDLDPDIIIIGYVTNDPDYDPSVGGDTPFHGHYYGIFSQVLDMPLKDIMMKYWPGIYQTLDLRATFIFSPTGIFRDKIGVQQAVWEGKTLLEKKHLSQFNTYVVKPLGKFAASINIPIILVTTPEDPDIKVFKPKYTPVLPLFEQAGIKTYNMLNDFYNTCSSDKYKANYAINPANSHPGTTDTWFYSKYIADMLESNYPNILGKKTLTGKEIYNINVNDWMPFSLTPHFVTESDTSAKYVISYPAKNSKESFLYMPAKEHYVKLNFKYPVDISSVTIGGKKLDSATLYVTGINKDLGFDDQVMHKLGKKSGRTCEWTENSALRVTSLCIHAETTDETGDNLTVTVTCNKGGVSP